MSCHYPMCMRGGGHCPNTAKCDKEADEIFKRKEEKRLLDLEEQKARIALMNAEASLLVKQKIKADLESMGDM